MRLFVTVVAICCVTVTLAEHIDCNVTQCHDSVIDASNASDLTLSCPVLNACRNTTVICPIGNQTVCAISCTDSLSCDTMTINSQSTATSLNCISSNIDQTNICTNKITINLHQNTDTLINCTGTNVTVCDSITINSNNTDAYATNVYFYCVGDGAKCDAVHVNTPNVENMHIVLNGTGSHLNGSRFISNNNVNIELNGYKSLISKCIFQGPLMIHGSSARVRVLNESILKLNTFILNDVSTFNLFGAQSSSLFTQNNITITNKKGRLQKVLINEINGDGTNNINAERASVFALKCRNNDTKCGNLGAINVQFVEDIDILIDDGVYFSDNIINAQDVLGFNMSVLEGAFLNGLSLNVAKVQQISINIYGETRGKNVINGSTALGFDVFCNNPASCSDELELIISPRRTKIHCVGTACDTMTFNVADSADEFSVDLSYCPCDEYRHTLCINNKWNIICDKTSSNATIINGKCVENDAGDKCCGEIISEIQETFANQYECPSSNETAYICQAGAECVINCKNTTQYNEKSPFKCSSSSFIDASHAKSVDIQCDKDDAACTNLNILCPRSSAKKSNCSISCAQNGSCSHLKINTSRSDIVYVGCLADASCKNITIDNKAEQVAMSYNAISVECAHGLCTDINIYGDGALIWFKCIKNSTCNRCNISNTAGKTTLYLIGETTTFNYSNIASNALKISGKSYVFSNNTIKYNTLSVNGDSAAIFNNNSINNDFTLSLNNGTGILFTATANDDKKSLIFSVSVDISMTVAPNNSFNDYNVRIVNPLAQLLLFNDGGYLTNNVFDAKQIQNVKYDCMGICHSNQFLVDYVVDFFLNNLILSVMNGSNTKISTSNLTNLHILNVEGTLSNFDFTSFGLKSINMSNVGGVMSNISLNAVDNVTVINYNNGKIDNLYIAPSNKMIVNITGNFYNSIINATKTSNLSVICSSDDNENGYCNNVTLIAPIAKEASASLLCRNIGCQNLTFYTVNNIDDDVNVSLKECKCESAVKNSCVQNGNEWNIFCNNNDNESSIFVNNSCAGECCGEITNDLKIKACDYNGGGSKKKNKTGAIVAGVCGAILFFVVVAGAIYYFNKKKKAQQEADALLVND